MRQSVRQGISESLIILDWVWQDGMVVEIERVQFLTLVVTAVVIVMLML